MVVARPGPGWPAVAGVALLAAILIESVLGIGGQDLSDRERDTMADIADGLGAPQSQDSDNQELPDEEATEELPTSSSTAQGETGPDGQPIGPDNIREGRVRGVMGGPNQQQGEGQGG